MIDGLNEDKAKEIGELIECLSQDGQNRKLVVIAPHGGIVLVTPLSPASCGCLDYKLATKIYGRSYL
jgi:hypothetical protein